MMEDWPQSTRHTLHCNFYFGISTVMTQYGRINDTRSRPEMKRKNTMAYGCETVKWS